MEEETISTRLPVRTKARGAGSGKKHAVYTVLVVLAVILSFIGIFPFLWMAISGFKPKTEVLATPFRFFPKVWTFDNYKMLFINKPDTYLFPKGASFLGSLGVTFAVSISALALSLIINSMAAYAFARLKFPGKRIAWAYYAVTMFVPNIAVLIPCFKVVSVLHLNNTVFALVLPGLVYVWSIFFYRQFYLGMPQSLEDAARIDGCGRLGIYFKIFIPMSATPFVVMGISVFQGYWNSYIWPTMTIQTPALYQVNQLIAFFRSSQEIAWNMLLASSTIAAIPMIVLLFVLQKYIMQGIKISGVK